MTTADDLRRRFSPTSFGWCVLTIGVGSLLLPRQVFNAGDPRPIVGVAVLSVFVAEFFLVHRRDRDIIATASVPQILRMNEPVTINVQASGPSTGPVNVRHFTTASLTVDGHAVLQWTPKRRGMFRLRDVRLFVSGPFGLIQRTTEIAPNGHGIVIIGPARYPLIDRLAPPTWMRQTTEDDDIHGFRPYVPGDDVRSVHWRMSAREGRPIVVTSTSPQKPIRVIVDLGAVAGPKAEMWAQIAASFLDDMLRNGPLVVTIRDSHGITSATVSSVSDIDAMLALAETGEPVPLDDTDADAYVGVWRTDLAQVQRAGTYVLSEYSLADTAATADAAAGTTDTRDETVQHA